MFGFFPTTFLSKSTIKKTPETEPAWDPKLSNEKNPGCFVYIGDYTTHLYRDYIKPL